MTPTYWLRRFMIILAALPLFANALMPSAVDAATRLFVVANELAQIWEIDPVTGAKVPAGSFSLLPPVASSRSGLAFDGTFLYYTDENLTVVQAYTTAGVLDHTLPKPTGTEPGSGLGAAKTSVFLVGLDNVITEIDSTTLLGTVLNSFTIPGAAHGLTFAGSRNSLFVVVNDSTTIKELSTTGAELASFNGPAVFRGLAFSSFSGTLFGVRQGFLWALNAATHVALPGYPVQIHDDVTNLKLLKSSAAAADEVVVDVCGDGIVNATAETCDPPSSPQTNGQLCRDDCTYCGDEVVDTSEQCDDGNAVNGDDCRNDCTLPRCGDGVKDANEACDDGNNVDGDGCSANCTAFCGDGVINQPSEHCEPPNTPGCDANCDTVEVCTDLVDNDDDGQIDCLDPDCDCLPIGRDPGAIRFGREGVGDLLSVHGSLDPDTQLSPSSEVISVLLTNANGKIFQLQIPAGDVKQIGRNLFRYRNRFAQKTRDGLARFDVRYLPRRDIFTFLVKVYGDLSAATEPAMNFQLVLGDDAFLNQSTWSKLPKGWVLQLPGE